MIDTKKNFTAIAEDLGLFNPIVKGQVIPVRNCWHFYTSGDSVEVLYRDAGEFRDGMNRILPVVVRYEVAILAFVLMDTHLHFILYGSYDACNRFVHEYLRRTSIYLSLHSAARKSLKQIVVNYQPITDDKYLKSAICYVLRNPVAAGLPYNVWDYPWSSASLYFPSADSWTSPRWTLGIDNRIVNDNELRTLIKSRVKIDSEVRVVNRIILPSQYVAASIVEKLFRSHKAYNYFLNATREVDIESRGGSISHLTVPLCEMRDNRAFLLNEMFGVSNLRSLDMGQRVELARCMKRRYNCSIKQIAKMCGLVYNEVKDIL